MEPFATLIGLLRPRAAGTKLIQGGGPWAVRYAGVQAAGFGLVLAGDCSLAVDGHDARRLAMGDFVLMPPTAGFTIASDPDAAPVPIDAAEALRGPAADVRHGAGELTFQMLGGYFQVETANIGLLAGLLPALVHIEAGEAAASRLAWIIDLVADEAVADRPGRDLVVDRLIEVMLVEALRFRAYRKAPPARPGLLEGLADPHLARALRCLHGDVARNWTVAELAREAGLSRSAFSDRFTQTVGAAPMEYLTAWRMAVAKDMLQHGHPSLEGVAAAIGYQSASAFSTAFRRHVGCPPRSFGREAL